MNPWQELLAGSPQATALLSAAGQPTRYQQLAQAVQAARARLRAVGLGPEDHLLVLAEGGPTCLLNLLAASAWCRCVVLAGNTPAFDLQRCQAELQARAVLGSASWLGDWARPKDLVWLRPTPSGPAIAFDPQRPPCSHEQPCEFPFIVATSGTTGQRKWVELGRTQVLIGATSVAQGLQLGPGDVGLTLMPLHHVHGLILSTLSALASGGCALLPEAFDPHHLCSWIHSHQPSWYSASPSLHQAVLEALPDDFAWPSLRRLRSSAAPLSPQLRQRLEQRLGVPVQQGYGMTECPQICLQPPGPLGKPHNLEVELRQGQIFLRGPAVAGPTDDQGWFATGDLGHFDEEGHLCLSGRLRDLINRGGEKVPAWEVDQLLSSLPGVAEAACFGVPHPRLGEDLVAVVVPQPGANPDPDQLRVRLFEQLVEAWVPGQIRLVEGLPRTATGKLLRHQLSQQWQPTPQDSRPLTPTEQRLLPLWNQALNTARPSFKGSLFELGGDSIIASQLATSIEREFGRRLPLAEVLRHPTLSGLARLLDGPSSPPTPSQAPPRRSLRQFALGTPGEKELRFSLFFFSADGSSDDHEKYALLLEAARFADDHDFEAIWIPERHFDPFGGLYPNPSVLAAALATVTRRLHIRAGSTVAPLWDPLRLAENWSVVDNLSGGRVGVACASGWHPNDFVLAPERYEQRRSIALDTLECLRQLWRGQTVQRLNGAGLPTEVRIYPRPLQPELPCWLATHSGPIMLEAARRNLNLLTVLYDTTPEALAADLAGYREAGGKTVTLMLHTFLADDPHQLEQLLRGPYARYLLTNLGLQRSYSEGLGHPMQVPPEDQQHILDEAFQRLQSRALVGTPQGKVQFCRQLQAMGVDEVACLIDFGPDPAAVMQSLARVVELRQLLQQAPVRA